MENFNLQEKLIDVARLSEEIRSLDKVIKSYSCDISEHGNCIKDAIDKFHADIDYAHDDYEIYDRIDAPDACESCRCGRDAWVQRKQLRIKRGIIKNSISKYGNFLYRKQKNSIDN